MSPRPPSPESLANLRDLTEAETKELAEAYIDLLRLMSGALHECDTGYGFFSWNGRGFEITGHPPVDLIEHIRDKR